MNKVLGILGIIGLLAGCASANWDNCRVSTASSNYTVQEPVEVIYRQTTYQTVYEPKTYATTKYVKKPYNHCTKAELCK
jgi:hypothetical protein